VDLRTFLVEHRLPAQNGIDGLGIDPVLGRQRLKLRQRGLCLRQTGAVPIAVLAVAQLLLIAAGLSRYAFHVPCLLDEAIPRPQRIKGTSYAVPDVGRNGKGRLHRISSVVGGRCRPRVRIGVHHASTHTGRAHVAHQYTRDGG
jgi:hypothetical protein